jgi:hypothetical protein
LALNGSGYVAGDLSESRRSECERCGGDGGDKHFLHEYLSEHAGMSPAQCSKRANAR